MTKYEHQAVFLSALATIVGLALAIYCKQGHWFARSGAIITVVAIWFASLDLRERVAGSASFVEEQLSRLRPENLKKALDAGMNSADADAVVQRIEDEVRADVAGEAKSASRRLLRTELVLFIAGTILWGFGDLPLDTVFHFLAQDACLDQGGRWSAATSMCER